MIKVPKSHIRPITIFVQLDWLGHLIVSMHGYAWFHMITHVEFEPYPDLWKLPSIPIIVLSLHYNSILPQSDILNLPPRLLAVLV